MSAILALLGTEQRSRGLETSFVNDPAAWLQAMFGGGPTASGVDVTEYTALEDPAVLSGVGGVAETMGSLPLLVYKRTGDGGKDVDRGHALYEPLHLSPNPEITSMTWREMKQAHLMLNGRTYSEIVRDAGGNVRELWPIHPRRVRVQRDRQTGWLVYRVTVPSAAMSSPAPGGPIRPEHEVILPPDQILHIRALSLDGVEGLGRLRLMRESFGLSLALRLFGAFFFSNGAQPGGVLEHPGRLTEAARTNLRGSIERQHQGLTRSHRMAILEEGMKYHELAMPNNRAQFLESREFQVGETARGLRVPGVMIGHNDKTSTYASAEQFFLSYVVHTIRPWAVRWDQALTMSLLTERERRTHFIEHKIDGLLRGDVQSRYSAYAIGRQWGWLSPDDVRRLENLNPLGAAKGGDTYLSPMNMVPLDRVDEVIDHQVKPDPPPAPAPAPEPDDDDDEDQESRSLLALYVGDIVRRALRREIEAVRKIGERDAANVDAWRAAVDEFYVRHAAYLAEALHVSLDTARAYTTDHRAALLAEGLAAAEGWNGNAEAAMIGLVGR